VQKVGKMSETPPENQNDPESDNGSNSMVAQIAAMQDYDLYRDLSWEGAFEEYLNVVRQRPQVTRNAFQRVYDMVISYGTEEYIDNKKKLVRYNFFRDEIDDGRDAIFGLDIPLMRLMNVLKAAAEGYGPEKRVILLHGPVGSSKSTIARLLKKGIEAYSRTPDGALYTFNALDSSSRQATEDVRHVSPEVETVFTSDRQGLFRHAGDDRAFIAHGKKNATIAEPCGQAIGGLPSDRGFGSKEAGKRLVMLTEHLQGPGEIDHGHARKITANFLGLLAMVERSFKVRAG
jgi:hypothetical protein